MWEPDPEAVEPHGHPGAHFVTSLIFRYYRERVRHLARKPNDRLGFAESSTSRGSLAIFGRSESPRPKLCPSCGTLVGATATRCHACGASINFSFAAANKALRRYLPTESPVTYAIVGLSGLLYVFSLFWTIRLGGDVLAGGGGILRFDIGIVNGAVLDVLGASGTLAENLAEPWRYVMAIFLHQSLLHIGFNMWVLIDIGPRVEQTYGHARTLFIYVLCGVSGYVLTSVFGSAAVGGSGALLGLVGVLLAMSTGYQSAAMQALRSSLVRWLIYIAVMSLLPGISLLAHLGGFASGFGLGKVLKDRPPESAEQRRLAGVLGWGTAAVVLICLAMAVREYLQIPAS